MIELFSFGITISTSICKSNYFDLYIIKVKEVIYHEDNHGIERKRRRSRMEGRMSILRFPVPDGYGYCENCGEPTNGWWEKVAKGEVFKSESEDNISPCDGIATVAIEDEKPSVLCIEEHSCVSHTEDKKVGETYYLRIPTKEGDSKEVIESRAMEKFFRELC